MSVHPLAGEDSYCPRCFRLAPREHVFCQFCGQFIHQNTPVDSRPWDTRPPPAPDAVPAAAPDVALSIDLPEEALPYGVAESAAGDKASSDENAPQPLKPSNLPAETTDSEST